MFFTRSSVIELCAKIQKITGIEFDEIEEEMPTLEIFPSQLVRVLTILSSHKDLLFQRLIDIIVVDRHNQEKRFEINYIIISLSYRIRLNIRINIEVEERINNIYHIYPAAYYRECEMAELFGIAFSNGQQLKKIITQNRSLDFPLRKSSQYFGEIYEVF